MRELKITDEPVTLLIYAHKHWNKTGVRLEAGNRYRLWVPDGELWRDGSMSPCGPEGFASPPKLKFFERLRRYPDSNWFSLIGTINGKVPFIIGYELVSFTPKITGELHCYANDLDLMYWNNTGSIRLCLERTA